MTRAMNLAQQHLDFAQHMTRVSRLVTLGEMAAGLAHELNQPLSAIATYAVASERLLTASGTQLPEVQEALREINAQALRAGDIIRRLRQLVRPRALHPEATDLNDLILQMWGLVESDARLNDVQIKFEPAQDLPVTELDGIQIQQVLFNLIHNGIEAFPDSIAAPRIVTVRTRQVDADALEMSVIDSGPGVDPAIANRMFEPFCTTKPEGTGLGLAVSRTIVQAHRGALEYRPNHPTGAIFSVMLPIVRLSPS